MGNVAMDVTRILASSMDELTPTDLSRHALDALRASRVSTIYVLGRRGPAQAAFTNPELKELGELAEADVIVEPQEVELDEHSAHQLSGHEDRTAEKNLPRCASLPRASRKDGSAASCCAFSCRRWRSSAPTTSRA